MAAGRITRTAEHRVEKSCSKRLCSPIPYQFVTHLSSASLSVMDVAFFVKIFSKKFKIPNFLQIRPLEAELLQADGQTDRQTDVTKLVVAFRNFANGPKKPKHLKTLIEEGNIMHHCSNKRHLNMIKTKKLLYLLQYHKDDVHMSECRSYYYNIYVNNNLIQ
jgi:hypothetical protein